MFNKEMLEKIEEITQMMETEMEPPVLENAKQALVDGRQLIGKLLTITDYAEGGWQVAS